MAKKIDAAYEGTKTLEALQGANNYNKWIADQILPSVHGATLEIGAGIGNLSDYFIGQNPLYLTELDTSLSDYLKNKYRSYANITTLELDVTKKIPQKLINHFGTIFAVNVLEHIQNDGLALSNIYTMLKKNGKAIFLVPANQFAYTSLDKSLGHFRRYGKKELMEKCEEAGFIVERIYFFNIVGLFSWIARDIFQKGKQLGGMQVSLFDKIVPLLSFIERLIHPFTGISLIVILKKVNE